AQPAYHTQDLQWTAPQAAPPAAMPRKRGGAGIIIGVVALVVLLAAGAVGVTFLGKLLNRPAVTAARLLPATTLAYLTIDPAVTGSQKAALDTMRAAFEAQPGFKEAWARIASSAAKSGGGASDTLSDMKDFDSLAQ